VAGTALVAWAWLGEAPSVRGMTGVVLVCIGILLLGIRGRGARPNPRPYLLALLVGVTIAGYSVVDKLGVGRVHPLVYVFGLAAGTVLCLAPVVLVWHRDDCRRAWRSRKGLSAWIGLGSMGTYLLVLFAFRLSGVSYVVAVRELSIVIVVLLGRAVLQEPITVSKLLSVTAIAGGVIFIKTA
jgi:drug/metabolite transporter (DMT)-like permease